MSDRILILGASARAAAQSAQAAGLEVTAIDLFGDQDLRSIANVETCPPDGYPHLLPEIARRFGRSPFCYTGGLENHGPVIEQLAADRPLYGVPTQVLSVCRDPFALVNVAKRLNIEMPRTSHRPAASAGQWLVKRYASCGGSGIELAESDAIPTNCFVQEFVSGDCYSGSFLADSNGCMMLGVARQFTARGIRMSHPHPFAFAGCLGPLRLTPNQINRWETLGDRLSSELSLRGLFGIDAIWQRESDADPTLLEINPRFTASMELFDLCRQTERPVMGQHWDVFAANRTSTFATTASSVGCKAIVYADRDTTIDSRALSNTRMALPDGLQLVDVPTVPQMIKRGQPVATLIGRFESETAAISALRLAHSETLASQIQRRLADHQTITDCMP